MNKVFSSLKVNQEFNRIKKSRLKYTLKDIYRFSKLNRLVFNHIQKITDTEGYDEPRGRINKNPCGIKRKRLAIVSKPILF